MTAADLAPFVASGHVAVRRHPTLPLTLYNYKPQAQYEYRTPEDWPEPVRAARGLVLSDTGEVVARPWPKFFNLSQYAAGAFAGQPFEAFEKYDGSLFIVARYGSETVTATRGSFVSEQAVRGGELLPEWQRKALRAGYTYLFEVIYPANRIVVNYEGAERLVLLGCVHTATGDELSYVELSREADAFGWPCAERHGYWLDFDGGSVAQVLPERPNAEGYVLRFQSGARAKVKHAEYLRLHRLVTGVSERTVWEWLAEGRDLGSMLEAVPDEFYEWVRATSAALMQAFTEAQERARAEHAALTVPGDRKACAIRYREEATVPMPWLFHLLDGRDPAPLIWKHLRPESTRPFFADPDA